MEKRFSKILIILLVVSMFLTACAPKTDEPKSDKTTNEETGKTEAKSAAMVLPGLKTDEAFNQYTYEGMLRASKENGIKTAFREEVSQDEQLEVIRQFAQQGYDIIIGQGGQFGEALKTAALEFPDKQFVFSVATETYGVPNLTAATVSYSHAGYLGGIMAAYASKTKKVAMITGEWYDPHRQMEASFYKGIQSVDPEIKTTSVTTGDWADVNKAREASLALISDGYDVLFFCLDAAYVGVLAAAEDSKDVSVVGAVVDASKVAPKVTVGSVVYNWEELGYQETLGNILDGKTHILGMNENGITPVINNLSDEGKAAVEKAIEGLKSGEIKIDK